MSFFYDLNKKLDSIRATPEVTHQQLNERNMSQHAKGIAKYTQPGMEELSRLGRKGASKAKMDAARKEFNQYDNEEVDEAQDFGPGTAGRNKNQAGPAYSFSPDTKNYKTPNLDRNASIDDKGYMKDFNKEIVNTTMGPDTRGNQARIGATTSDGQGQTKYVNRTAPGVINKIKDKLGMDMPDPAYGPKPDERERLAKRYPAPAKSVDEGGEVIDGVYKLAIEPKRPQEKENKMTRGTRPAPKGEFMGTIKGGVWTADPPKPGERGVPAPSGDPEGVKEGGMTAKRKFTFADKIAGAKREVDEMLGDVAAEAMRSALSPKQKKMAALGGDPKRIDARDLEALRKGAKPEMDEERSKGTAFDMSTRRVDTPKAGSTERGAKHDITHSTSDPRYKGRTVIRRTDAQGISVGSETDDEGNKKEKRTKAGRPDGTGKKIGAKGPSGKSKLMTREGEVDIRDQGEYDQEGDMAKDTIKTVMRHAQALSKVLGDNDNLPEWVQSKLAKIEGMMVSIDEYMQNQQDDGEEPIAEEPKSKNQAVAARIARGVQKGTAKAKPGSASAEMAKMEPKELNKFAKGSTKGLPKKVSKKKEVDENSEDGRLTTTQTGPGKTSTSSSTGRISATVDKGTVSVKPAKSGGMSYGKGIYDSINLELENMIAESMSINMSDSTDGNKSLTITATDEDAMKLAMMLKNAGIGGHGDDMYSSGEQACGTCGMPDCGCGDVDRAIDENAPDYPTNKQTSNNALQYAGGLNKPKTDVAGDGQSTVPVVATHPHNEDALRRMMEMAGLAEAAKPDFLDINKNGDKEESMKDAADDVNEEDTVEESIRRMMEIAGVKKKPMDEQKTEEGNLFTKGLEDNDVKIGDRIPGTNAIKKKDIDESIFALTNQWQAYKGQ